MYSPCTEQLAGVKHCNGVDVWVITHEFNSNNFRCYLVTATGVSAVPVISSVGTIVTGGFGMGMLKFSPNGRKLGMSLNFPSRFNLYDFDPATGIVSNELILASNISNPYGCEFSADGTKFYGRGNTPVLYQWDLCAGNNAAVIASQYSMATTSFSASSALQLAPDGKIYISRANTQTISVINNPNVGGTGCNYINIGLNLTPGISKLGLPNFISNYFNQVQTQPFTYSIGACQNVSFTAAAQNQTSCASSPYPSSGVLWNFGDISSSPSNTSSLTSPIHGYTNPGTYTAQLLIFYPCRTDTITQTINIPDTRPTFTLIGNNNICKNETTTLSAISTMSQGVLSYTWGPNTSTIATAAVSPSTTTIYSVTVQNQSGCASSKTIQVTVSPCTGINEENHDTSIYIYPNPNDGLFYFETRIEKFSYKICNNLGMIVNTGITESGQRSVDVKELANGLYFVEIRTAGSMRLLKFVKSD